MPQISAEQKATLANVLSEGGKGGASPANPPTGKGTQSASGGGNPAATPAPAAGQPTTGQSPKGQEPKSKQTTPPNQPSGSGPGAQEAPPPMSQEGLDKAARAALGLKTVEPNTADHWKGKYEASSKEGRDKAQRLAAVTDSLKKLGLGVTFGEKGAEFIPDSSFVASKGEEVAKGLFGKLSDEEKNLAMDNPAKFTELIAGKVLQTTARPVPTISRDDVSIGESDKDAIRKSLTKATGEDKKPEYPDFDKLEPYIQALLEDGVTPEPFKKWMNQTEDNYRFGMALLYGRVHQKIAPLIAAQLDAQRQLEEKKQSAISDVSLTSEGTRRSQAQGGAGVSDEALEIVNAKPQF